MFMCCFTSGIPGGISLPAARGPVADHKGLNDHGSAGSGNIQNHEIGIEIQHAPAPFSRTRIVVLSTRILLVNQLATDIQVRQSNALHLAPLTIKANATVPYHWKSPSPADKKSSEGSENKSPQLSFRRILPSGSEGSESKHARSGETEGWMWTGWFSIDSVCAHTMMVRKAPVVGSESSNPNNPSNNITNMNDLWFAQVEVRLDSPDNPLSF